MAISYWWRHGYLPRLALPAHYNEWVQWRKLNDRDVTLGRLTDKLYAKGVASALLGARHVTPTLWQGARLPLVPPWPMPFIVKANHGCNQYVVVRSVRDWQRARRQAPKWLKASYGQWLDEWHYRCATPLLLVEPFVGNGDALPTDFKVFVFGGVARFVQVQLDRATDHRWIQFDRDWTRLSAAGDDVIERPECLADMLRAAEVMAADHDHLRVDFYEVDGVFRFGEYCLFPGSGLDPFDPPSLDVSFGACWTQARTGRATLRAAA